MCPIFFIKFLFFDQMIALQKQWKIFFILSKKFFSFSRYSNCCNFSPSFPHFPDSKGQMEVELFMMSWIGLHKFTGVIFGITQKPHYITPSNLVRWYITNKEIFVNLFRNLKSNWSLVPGPFCSRWLCPLKGTGFRRKNKVNFFRVLDNPLSRYLILKIISCM